MPPTDARPPAPDDSHEVSPWTVDPDGPPVTPSWTDSPPMTAEAGGSGVVAGRHVTVASAASRPGEAFSEPVMLRPREPDTPRGWRGMLGRITGRAVAAPASETEWDSALRRCRQPAPGGRRIAVISRKGGVGKTTSTLMIGHTLAAIRQDRVLAIDGNPDAGTLGHRVVPQTTATVVDVLASLGSLAGYPDVRRLTSQAPSRLEVLASPADPHQSRSLSGRDYQVVMAELEKHYNLLLCDTGTGILDDANLGILNAVDQVVVVTAAALDSARAAGMTLDWLDAHGGQALVADAVVVINAVGDLGRVDIDQVSAHFRARTRAVHHVGYDRHLEAGSTTDPDQLAPATQEAWLQVAASVADGFALPSPRDLPEGLR